LGAVTQVISAVPCNFPAWTLKERLGAGLEGLLIARCLLLEFLRRSLYRAISGQRLGRTNVATDASDVAEELGKAKDRSSQATTEAAPEGGPGLPEGSNALHRRGTRRAEAM